MKGGRFLHQFGQEQILSRNKGDTLNTSSDDARKVQQNKQIWRKNYFIFVLKSFKNFELRDLNTLGKRFCFHVLLHRFVDSTILSFLQS